MARIVLADSNRLTIYSPITDISIQLLKISNALSLPCQNLLEAVNNYAQQERSER
jgi:hypothetical protein